MSVLQGRRRVWAWGRVFSEQALQDLRGKEYLHPFSRKGEGRRRSGGAAATKQASLFPRQIKHRPSRFHLTTAPDDSGAVVRLFVKQVTPAQLPEAPHVVRPAGTDFGLRSSGKDHFTDIPHADESFRTVRRKTYRPAPGCGRLRSHISGSGPPPGLRRAASGSNRRRGRACLRAADVWLPRSDGA